MRNYIILLLFGFIFFFSCTKVDKLSDEANIVSFQITQVTDGVDIDRPNITINNNTVAIPLLYGRKFFPLKLAADIQFSSTTEDIISTDASPLNLKEFTFKDVYSKQNFYLISESGIPHLAEIVLIDNPNAEITGFTIQNHEADTYIIQFHDNNIRIVFKQNIDWPITIEPEISITPGATFTNYKPGEPLIFAPFENTKKITLRAEDGDEKTWNIQIVSSIENSDFEKWINVGDPNKLINIDPIPGKGLGWATANNSFVAGTTPVPHDNGYAAQLQTGIQNLSSLGLGELITAGSIFTGYFKMNLNLDELASMTYLGIPFIERPKSISVDAKYIAGSKFQQSVKKNKGGYELTDITGVDEGRIWVEILHYEGEGPLEYHMKDVKGLTVLGKGEIIFKGSDKSLVNWNTYEIPIIYSNKTLKPTHIVIVMTSSRQGDYFIGAKGSTLTVDNVIINY